jgi:hypothetical protein
MEGTMTPEELRNLQPPGENHVQLYTIKTQPHDYDLCCGCAACYTQTQNLITNFWKADPVVQNFTKRRLKKYRPRIDNF